MKPWQEHGSIEAHFAEQAKREGAETEASGVVLNVPSSRLNLASPAISTDSGPIIINSHRTAIGSDMTSAPLRVSGAAAASEGQVSEDPVSVGPAWRQT